MRAVARLGAVSLALALLLTACGDDEEPNAPDPVTEEAPGVADDGEDEIEDEAILDSLHEYEGEEVNVTTAVAEVLTDEAFVVYSHATSGDKVLVLAEDGTGELAEGDVVTIDGMVQAYDSEDAPSWMADGDDESLAEFDGDLSLIVEAGGVTMSESS